MTNRILIIKLGYSETLDPEIGIVPSIGDVLRTTPVLWAVRERFPDAHLTWLVSANAKALLQDVELIDQLLVWDEFVPFQLMKQNFDVLINLEKVPGVCALADMIDAWMKYGFRFDAINGTYHAYEQGLDFISYLENKKQGQQLPYWQQVLVEMLGVTWQEQPYVIGYESKASVEFDVGFNVEVGSKWPVKAMPAEKWQALESRLTAKGLTVSWQEGKSNLYEYMDWIQSNRLLVSNDSLGLHIAMAFGIPVVGIFGPTDPNEVFFYDGSRAITAQSDCPIMPCRATRCEHSSYCMDFVDLEHIEATVLELLNADR